LTSLFQRLTLDRKGYRILIFDKRGNLIKALGRRGDGPGEFKYPMALAIDNKNLILVLDFSLRRISKFSEDEGFLDSFILSGGHDPIGSIRVNSTSSIYLSGFKRESYRNLEYGTWIHKYSSGGKYELSFFPSNKLNRNWVSRIGPFCSFDIDEDDIIYAIQHCAYEISKYQSDGTLIDTFGKRPVYFKPPNVHNRVDLKAYDTQSGLIKKLNELSISWTKLINIAVVKNNYVLVIMESNDLVRGCDKKYLIDIWDKEGNFIAGPICTDYRLLCRDENDYLYFEKSDREIIRLTSDDSYTIEKCRLSLVRPPGIKRGN
jgi:hypothetical protein